MKKKADFFFLVFWLILRLQNTARVCDKYWVEVEEKDLWVEGKMEEVSSIQRCNAPMWQCKDTAKESSN